MSAASLIVMLLVASLIVVLLVASLIVVLLVDIVGPENVRCGIDRLGVGGAPYR